MFSELKYDVAVFSIPSGQSERLLRLKFHMRGYCPDVIIYRKLAGNIIDSKTIYHLLLDLVFLGHSKKKRIMDHECYSRSF